MQILIYLDYNYKLTFKDLKLHIVFWTCYNLYEWCVDQNLVIDRLCLLDCSADKYVYFISLDRRVIWFYLESYFLTIKFSSQFIACYDTPVPELISCNIMYSLSISQRTTFNRKINLSESTVGYRPLRQPRHLRFPHLVENCRLI